MKPKLAIFGDSYAFKAPGWSEAWTGLIENEYDTDHYAKYGTSIWIAFKHFLKHYHKYTHIVFCYSNHNRIHYLPEEIEQYCFLRGQVPEVIRNIRQDDRNVLDIVFNAFPYITDEKLDEFIYQQVFNEVNRLCKINNIRLINLLPFEKSYQEEPIINLENAVGPCIMGLAWLSLNERTRPNIEEGDPRMCHMSPENNKAL